jgi:hypothetical protein
LHFWRWGKFCDKIDQPLAKSGFPFRINFKQRFANYDQLFSLSTVFSIMFPERLRFLVPRLSWFQVRDEQRAGNAKLGGSFIL